MNHIHLTMSQCRGKQLEQLIEVFAPNTIKVVLVMPDTCYEQLFSIPCTSDELCTLFCVYGKRAKIKSNHQFRFNDVLRKIGRVDTYSKR